MNKEQLEPIWYKYHYSNNFINLINDNAMVISRHNHTINSCESQVISTLQKEYPAHYLLCVGYSVADQDVQIAISGTRKIGETLIETATRELQEESFLHCKNLKKIKIENKSARCYIGHINDCIMDEIEESLIDDIKKSPEIKTKVHIYIHGTLEEFKGVYNKGYYKEKYNDDIDRIVLIPLSRFKYSPLVGLYVKNLKFVPGSNISRNIYENGKIKQKQHELLFI